MRCVTTPRARPEEQNEAAITKRRRSRKDQLTYWHKNLSLNFNEVAAKKQQNVMSKRI